MEAINSNQFSLKTLFLIVFASAVFIVVCQLASTAIPELITLCFVIAITLAVLGFGLFSTACIFALAIVLTHKENENRETNLSKCGRMAGMGIAAMAPLSVLMMLVPVLSLL